MPRQSSIVLYNDAGAEQANYALPMATTYGLSLRTFQIVTRGGEQIAFYSGQTDATASLDTGSATIFAYNITTATDLGVIESRPRVVGSALQQVDSLTALSDGSIVASWTIYSQRLGGYQTLTTVRVYNTSNALTLEYDLPLAGRGFGFFADAVNASSVLLSSPAATNATWWIRQISTTGGGSILREVEIEKPTAVVEVLPFFPTGVDRFAVTQEQTPGPFTGEPPIRWVRRTPHSISGLKRLFFGRTELLMDVGQGGTAPTVSQRYSNDGGQTWGDGITKSIGEAGATNARVFWPTNGSGRDRVWEWYGQGDAPVKLVDCFVDAKEGIS